jgi:hypothetical protein
MRDILGGVPPASFLTHLDRDHELLASVFSKSWHQVPRQRPDMHSFSLRVDDVRILRIFGNKAIQQEQYQNYEKMIRISNTLPGTSRLPSISTLFRSIDSAPYSIVYERRPVARADVSTIMSGSSTSKRTRQVEISGTLRLRNSREAALLSRRQRGFGHSNFDPATENQPRALKYEGAVPAERFNMLEPGPTPAGFLYPTIAPVRPVEERYFLDNSKKYPFLNYPIHPLGAQIQRAGLKDPTRKRKNSL